MSIEETWKPKIEHFLWLKKDKISTNQQKEQSSDYTKVNAKEFQLGTIKIIWYGPRSSTSPSVLVPIKTMGFVAELLLARVELRGDSCKRKRSDGNTDGPRVPTFLFDLSKVPKASRRIRISFRWYIYYRLLDVQLYIYVYIHVPTGFIQRRKYYYLSKWREIGSALSFTEGYVVLLLSCFNIILVDDVVSFVRLKYKFIFYFATVFV